MKPPTSLLASGRGCCVSGVARCPLLIAGLAGRLRGWAASFLLTASNSVCSPWITGPYNMHATALNARLSGAGCMRSGAFPAEAIGTANSNLVELAVTRYWRQSPA